MRRSAWLLGLGCVVVLGAIWEETALRLFLGAVFHFCEQETLVLVLHFLGIW